MVGCFASSQLMYNAYITILSYSVENNKHVSVTVCICKHHWTWHWIAHCVHFCAETAFHFKIWTDVLNSSLEMCGNFSKRQIQRERESGRVEEGGVRCMFIHTPLINYPASLQQEIEKQSPNCPPWMLEGWLSGDENITIGPKKPRSNKESPITHYTQLPWLFSSAERKRAFSFLSQMRAKSYNCCVLIDTKRHKGGGPAPD